MENEKTDVASCFVCDKEMASDIFAKNYCRLCGMIIENSKEEFCCTSCENKFVKIHIVK